MAARHRVTAGRHLGAGRLVRLTQDFFVYNNPCANGACNTGPTCDNNDPDRCCDEILDGTGAGGVDNTRNATDVVMGTLDSVFSQTNGGVNYDNFFGLGAINLLIPSTTQIRSENRKQHNDAGTEHSPVFNISHNLGYARFRKGMKVHDPMPSANYSTVKKFIGNTPAMSMGDSSGMINSVQVEDSSGGIDFAQDQDNLTRLEDSLLKTSRREEVVPDPRRNRVSTDNQALRTQGAYVIFDSDTYLFGGGGDIRDKKVHETNEAQGFKCPDSCILNSSGECCCNECECCCGYGIGKSKENGDLDNTPPYICTGCKCSIVLDEFCGSDCDGNGKADCPKYISETCPGDGCCLSNSNPCNNFPCGINCVCIAAYEGDCDGDTANCIYSGDFNCDCKGGPDGPDPCALCDGGCKCVPDGKGGEVCPDNGDRCCGQSKPCPECFGRYCPLDGETEESACVRDLGCGCGQPGPIICNPNGDTPCGGGCEECKPIEPCDNGCTRDGCEGSCPEKDCTGECGGAGCDRRNNECCPEEGEPQVPGRCNECPPCPDESSAVIGEGNKILSLKGNYRGKDLVPIAYFNHDLNAGLDIGQNGTGQGQAIGVRDTVMSCVLEMTVADVYGRLTTTGTAPYARPLKLSVYKSKVEIETSHVSCSQRSNGQDWTSNEAGRHEDDRDLVPVSTITVGDDVAPLDKIYFDLSEIARDAARNNNGVMNFMIEASEWFDSSTGLKAAERTSSSPAMLLRFYNEGVHRPRIHTDVNRGLQRATDRLSSAVVRRRATVGN